MMYGEWIEGPSYEAFTGVHFRDRWTEENQNGNAEMPRLERLTTVMHLPIIRSS